ncbi:unnamed protein product, partial [Durusdinium trenchii]
EEEQPEEPDRPVAVGHSASAANEVIDWGGGVGGSDGMGWKKELAILKQHQRILMNS